MIKAHLHLIKWAVARGYSVAWSIGEGEFDGVHSTYEDIKDATSRHATWVKWILLLVICLGTARGRVSGHVGHATFAYVLEYDQEPEESID